MAGHQAAQANAPSATTTRSVGRISSTSRCSHGAQVSRSTGVGLLSGGAHRTAAKIRVSRSASPSSAATLVGWLASPARCSAAKSTSPERSPVKIRPVRLPPCAAGASPRIAMRASARAEPGHRTSPVVLVAERRPLHGGDLLPPRHQPRAGEAVGHAGVEVGQVRGRRGAGGDLCGGTGGHAFRVLRKCSIVRAQARAADGLS